jgi:hypothetical protein
VPKRSKDGDLSPWEPPTKNGDADLGPVRLLTHPGLVPFSDVPSGPSSGFEDGTANH